MKHRNLMFDVDGVLADFIGGFTRLANSLHPTVPIVTTEQQPSYHDYPGMTKDQVNETWQHVVKDGTFWTRLDPLVGLDVLRRIAQLNEDHHVYFVTARHGIYAKIQTELWLQEQGIENPTVILTQNKGEIAKAIDADYSIEDSASNASVIAWLTSDKTKSYLINRPYNQCAPEFLASGVHRVDMVRDYLEAIDAN